MTDLKKDPSPGGTTTDGSTIYTDQHNAIVDRLGGEAAPTASRAAITDASGNLSTSAVTSTELGHVSGVTSSIQTQLNGKEATANKNANSGYCGLDSNGKVAKAQQLSTAVHTDQANSYTAGNKQTFQHSSTTAGLNVGTTASDPSSPADGDVWYHQSQGRLKIRASTTTHPIVYESSTDTLTNKTIVPANNTIAQTVPVAGQYLRDNGTKFVASAIQAGDIPDLSATYARTLQAEQNSTPVSDNADFTVGTTNTYYEFATLPNTYKFYIITGIEWKNGATVSGNIRMVVVLVDANPPTSANVQVVAYGNAAQSGASSIQTVTRLYSSPILGGSVLGLGLTASSASATLRRLTGQASQKREKATQVGITAGDILMDGTTWTNSTNYVYAKIYYKGVI